MPHINLFNVHQTWYCASYTLQFPEYDVFKVHFYIHNEYIRRKIGKFVSLHKTMYMYYKIGLCKIHLNISWRRPTNSYMGSKGAWNCVYLNVCRMEIVYAHLNKINSAKFVYSEKVHSYIEIVSAAAGGGRNARILCM